MLGGRRRSLPNYDKIVSSGNDVPIEMVDICALLICNIMPTLPPPSINMTRVGT